MTAIYVLLLCLSDNVARRRPKMKMAKTRTHPPVSPLAQTSRGLPTPAPCSPFLLSPQTPPHSQRRKRNAGGSVQTRIRASSLCSETNPSSMATASLSWRRVRVVTSLWEAASRRLCGRAVWGFQGVGRWEVGRFCLPRTGRLSERGDDTQS